MTPRRKRVRIFTWFRRSIQRKLVFWTMCFWLVSVTVLSVTVLWTGQSEILSSIRSQNIQAASIAARDVNSQISGVLADIRSFTSYLQTLDPDPTAQAAAINAFEVASPERYHGIYYFDQDADLMLYLNTGRAATPGTPGSQSNSPPVPEDVAQLAALQQHNGTGVSLSGLSYMEIDRTPVITIATSVNLAGGSRVLVVEVELAEMWQHLLRNRVGESGFTYAVAKTGLIIAHPDPTEIGKPVPTELWKVTLGYEGFVSYEARRGEVYAAYSPVGGPTGWGIVVEQDATEANAPIGRVAVILGGVWLALAVVGTAGILMLTRSFTRPIVELTSVTREIERTGQLVKTSLEAREDEVGQLSHSFDRMVERLARMEGRLATVAAEERNRLARDLHDAVSQTLFSASLIAEVLPTVWARNPEDGKKRLEEVRQLTRGALAEMRTLLLELRPAALVEAEMPTLLLQLAESIRGRAGIPVTVDMQGECEYGADVKIAVYRIAQEALNNVAKHAGASQVTVTATCRADELSLIIKDDGGGFDLREVGPNSLGVRIMRERSEEIGAALSIDSRPGQGTTVRVAWKRPAGERQQ